MPKKPPAPPEEAAPVVEWEPPEGYLVTNDDTFIIWVNGTRYEHVSEAPDGRWVYRPS